jgi:hypothetical protein
MPIVVFNLKIAGNIMRVVSGEEVGTRVDAEGGRTPGGDLAREG